MSQISVELALGRAILDSDFRERFFENPEEALAVFDLTQEEKTRIKKVDSETMDMMARTFSRVTSGLNQTPGRHSGG